MISLICVAATISGIFLFVNNKKKNQEFLFNIQKAQKLINNKLDIEYYTSEMFLETKKQINVILKDFSNINLKSIFTSFNQECNLLLNIVIECNNQEYKLIKKLRY